MKRIQLISCGVITGAILGWLANSMISESTNLEEDGMASREPFSAMAPGAANAPARGGETGKPATSADFLKQGIEAASRENRNLGNEEFGDKLAELLTGEISLEDQI